MKYRAFATRTSDRRRVLVAESESPINTAKLRDQLAMRSLEFDEATRIEVETA